MIQIKTYILTLLLLAATAVAAVAQGSRASRSTANMISSSMDYVMDVQKATIEVVDNKVVVVLKIHAIQDVPARQSVILVPELQDTISDRYVTFPVIYINSRNQQIFYEREISRYITDAMAVRKYRGKDLYIDYLRSVPYQRWMETGVLKLRKLSCGCNVSTERGEDFLCRLREAEPAVTTLPAFRVPKGEMEKVREEKGSAFLRFVTDKWDIRPDYMTNPAELQKINATIDLVRNDPDVQIRKMTIEGYASPEGNLQHNEMLSDRRTAALRDYLHSFGTLHDLNITARGRGENWEGFREALLANKDIPQRDILIGILNQQIGQDEKEQLMRKNANEGFIYCVNNYFPSLRCTNYAVEYTVRAFSIEESERVFETRPINLSLNEIYLLADKYKDTPARYNEIMQKASLLYPKDPYVNLSMSYLAIKRNAPEDAELYLKQVPEWPEKQLNMAIVRYLKGQMTGAELQKIQQDYYQK